MPYGNTLAAGAHLRRPCSALTSPMLATPPTSRREVGGQMLPLWPVYYRECPALVFVLDASNKAAVAQAAVELFEALGHADLQVGAVGMPGGWGQCWPWFPPLSSNCCPP